MNTISVLSAVAGAIFAVSLSGCGGGDAGDATKSDAAIAKPVAPVAVIPVEPASETATAAPIDAPAPVAASEPAGTSEPAASEPVTALAPVTTAPLLPASTPVISIDVYGDDASMSYRASPNYGPPTFVKTSAEYLQEALQKKFNDTGITVANHATGGTSASLMNLLDGMDGGGSPFAKRLAATNSSIVIISYALNEIYGGETISDFSGYLAQAIQVVRDAGRTPVLEEPGPTCDGEHPRMAQYVDAIDAIGKTYSVPVIAQYKQIIAISDWKSHMDATCELPDYEINAIKAKNELEIVAALLTGAAR
jgi:hypothetical protein